MKSAGINKDPTNRVLLDTTIRAELKNALESDSASVEEVVFLLSRMLAEMLPFVPIDEANRGTVFRDGQRLGFILGHVEAACMLALQRAK